MNTKSASSRHACVFVEALEGRQFLSADGLADIDATTATASTVSEVTTQAVGAGSSARHHKHHLHVLHTQHRAHVLRTTIPEPIVLTAQQRNDWPTIRDEFLASRKRVSK